MSRDAALANPATVVSADLKWEFQKNGDNGDERTFVRESTHVSLCCISALLRVVKRHRALNLPTDHPLAVHSSDGTTSGEVRLIRERQITTALRQAATAAHKLTDAKEIQRFSSHSIRVGACVALHAAGINIHDIMYALRWKSDSSAKIYLRNLPGQSARMAHAVTNFNPTRLNVCPAATILASSAA